MKPITIISINWKDVISYLHERFQEMLVVCIHTKAHVCCSYSQVHSCSATHSLLSNRTGALKFMNDCISMYKTMTNFIHSCKDDTAEERIRCKSNTMNEFRSNWTLFVVNSEDILIRKTMINSSLMSSLVRLSNFYSTRVNWYFNQSYWEVNVTQL